MIVGVQLMKKNFSLNLKIMFLVILILNLVLVLVGVIIINYVNELQVEEVQHNAMDIAQAVSKNKIIVDDLALKKESKAIQSLAEDIRKNTRANFIVVMDMGGFRYSHPDPEKIGKHFVGGDEIEVLETGESYTSRARGTLGTSIRAFIPIYKDGKQVGAVSVGILLENVEERINSISRFIIIALLSGNILGIIGSILLARHVKKSIFGLEPEEIAKILQEKIVIIDSIKEGIIAINNEKKITMANKQVKEVLNYRGELIGKTITDVIENSRLPKLLETGEPEILYEQNINDTVILTNRIPIIVNGQIVGAVASFNKKTEVQKLAKELTGVKKFAEALRSQNHEFMNQLHTISGLIQLEEYESALEIISQFTHEKQKITSFIMERIRINEIAGLLLGKFDQAKELNINLKIDSESQLTNKSSHLKERLITIIGNLIENARDSLDLNNIKDKEIYLGIFEKDKLEIIVRDNGPGIPGELQNKIFKRGFTTKGKDSQGIGLDLVKRNIDFLNGEINLNSQIGKGTEFKVIIPYQNKEGGESGENY